MPLKSTASHLWNSSQALTNKCASGQESELQSPPELRNKASYAKTGKRRGSRSSSYDPQPAPRTQAPSPQRKGSLSPSIKEFYDDAEFVEFLKQIALFVQAEESPQKPVLQTDQNGFSQRSYLYRNLQDLRERFKQFKKIRQSQRLTTRLTSSQTSQQYNFHGSAAQLTASQRGSSEGTVAKHHHHSKRSSLRIASSQKQVSATERGLPP